MYRLFSKIYFNSLYIIGVLTPIIVNVYAVHRNPEFYSDNSMLIIQILITVGMTLFCVYLFFYLMPKLKLKIFKKLSIKHYKNKTIFSYEKTVVVKDDSIEITYGDKKLIISLKENIFADEFKGNKNKNV